MIIQPFIENAILHGVNESDKTDLMISISFELNNTILNVKVNDNGIGIEQSKLKNKNQITEKKSAGTIITTERLKVLCKSMNQPFYLELLDLSDLDKTTSGTLITFNLPYKIISDETESNIN